VLSPTSLPELIDAVKSTACILPVGARTKPRLSASTEATLLDLRQLTGITEYQASEYTITARAGTTLTELNATLAAQGQYLPFDPPFAAAGATIGGTIAANLSGPGRIRFGGVRDFILGLTFIDSQGRLLHGGGKVVKNAAGFDTPKLMVGSLGRLGIITELTFKVFPRPPATLTLRLAFDSHQSALTRLAELTKRRYELDALDYQPADRTLLLRLAGPAESNTTLAQEIGGTSVPCESVWPAINDFSWAPSNHALVKIPTTPRTAAALIASAETIPDTRLHLTAGANLLWVSTADTSTLAPLFTHPQIAGQVILGKSPTIHLGATSASAIAASLQHVFDPHRRFPSAL
jgi:glycolate oxidase FAD binding subunit